MEWGVCGCTRILNYKIIMSNVRLNNARKLMLWCCMTWNGFGQACQIDGISDNSLYCEILEADLLCTAEYF